MTALASDLSVLKPVLATGGIVTHFQPITSIRRRSVVGMEALSRGFDALTGKTIPPDVLFRRAATASLTAELDRACRSEALNTYSNHSLACGDTVLFLNVDASTFTGGHQVVDDLMANVEALNLHPGNIAIEVLESRVDDIDAMQARLRDLRKLGFLVALDDVGSGHSNLDRVPIIRPDVLKIDRGLIKNIDQDYYKQEVFKSLVNLCRKIGALVVAEGVETAGEVQVTSELGADLLQGYYFARPRPLDEQTGDAVLNKVDETARMFKSYMVDKINARKLQHRQYNIIVNFLLCELSRVTIDEFTPSLQKLLQTYPEIECAYVLDESGKQISQTVFAPSAQSANTSHMFKPARIGTDHSLKEYYYVLLDVELNKYTTEPYVSLASGNLCRTISTLFRDSTNTKLFVLCVDVKAKRT